MKKYLLIGIISVLACSSINAKAALLPTTELSGISSCVVYAASSPKVKTRGDRVIIIYDDGTTIVVDKNGTTTTVPSN